MKYLGDCEINNLDNTKNAWAYVEDYLFLPNGTLIISGTGYRTYERPGKILVLEAIK